MNFDVEKLLKQYIKRFLDYARNDIEGTNKGALGGLKEEGGNTTHVILNGGRSPQLKDLE